MLGEDEKILVIDVEQDAPHTMGSVSLSREYDKLLEDKEFDRIRIKTKLFTKEYDSDRKLLHIEPFFIDVRLTSAQERTEEAAAYVLTTGAKVQILRRLDNVGFIYNIRIPETNVTFKQLAPMDD